MVLGYRPLVYDNKYRMYGNLNLGECARFRDIYDINRIDPEIKIKTRKDISSTYDNFDIVSEKFKSFCLEGNYGGLEFVFLPGSPGFYWFKVNNILELDPADTKIRYINYSEECLEYEEVIGPFSLMLKNKDLIPEGFFRSNLFFGSFQSKFPVLIIGDETRNKLKAAGFKIDCAEICDKYK